MPVWLVWSCPRFFLFFSVIYMKLKPQWILSVGSTHPSVVSSILPYHMDITSQTLCYCALCSVAVCGSCSCPLFFYLLQHHPTQNSKSSRLVLNIHIIFVSLSHHHHHHHHHCAAIAVRGCVGIFIFVSVFIISTNCPIETSKPTQVAVSKQSCKSHHKHDTTTSSISFVMRVWSGLVWFGLVWSGLVVFSIFLFSSHLNNLMVLYCKVVWNSKSTSSHITRTYIHLTTIHHHLPLPPPVFVVFGLYLFFSVIAILLSAQNNIKKSSLPSLNDAYWQYPWYHHLFIVTPVWLWSGLGVPVPVRVRVRCVSSIFFLFFQASHLPWIHQQPFGFVPTKLQERVMSIIQSSHHTHTHIYYVWLWFLVGLVSFFIFQHHPINIPEHPSTFLNILTEQTGRTN